MIRLSIVVDDISLVLETYDRIKVYRSSSEDGVFVEISDAVTRPALIPEDVVYYYNDATGDNTHWYRTSYYHSTTFAESPQSAARQGGTEVEKIGYSFKNYSAPPSEWGKILTADDMRYTYMWGIDATASDIAETSFEDEQFDFYIEDALADFEKELTIDIRKKVYKTNPESSLIRGPEWREGVDFTDYEDPYSFDPAHWQNFGFLQLRHYPIQSVERAVMINVVGGDLIDLLDKSWVRIGSRTTGRLNFCHAVQRVARPGTSRMAASAMPTRARHLALQPSATRISRLTEVSSRKSIESANRDTEPIASATANSTPK